MWPHRSWCSEARSSQECWLITIVQDFFFLRGDIRGLYLPSILPVPWYHHLDLPGETSHTPPSGLRAPLWSLSSQGTGVGLRSHSGELYILPPSPQLLVLEWESKWIIWDSGIQVELSRKRSWAGSLHQSSGVGGGARAQVRRTCPRMKPVTYKARWTDRERDEILMTMREHPHPPEPVVNPVGPLKPL